MAQKKAKRKKQKAKQSQQNRPATPSHPKITDPQIINTGPKQETIESTEGPPKEFVQNAESEQQAITSAESPPTDTPQKRMTLAEKFSLLILFGLLCVNVFTLWTMREDAKLEKRAWVGLDKVIDHPFKPGEKLAFELIITNTGKTPAINAKVHYRLARDPSDTYLSTFFTSDIPNEPMFAKAAFTPNARIALADTTDDTLSELSHKQIESNEIILFVLAKVEYEDIFECNHKTYICLHYSPESQTLVAYHKYNYMD